MSRILRYLMAPISPSQQTTSTTTNAPHHDGEADPSSRGGDLERDAPHRGVPRQSPRLTLFGNYDPVNGRLARDPEPVPYDEETYRAWGLNHFGAEWCYLRDKMLRERNVYKRSDGDYQDRQSGLRRLEREIEGRPPRPRMGIADEGWKRLWSRISRDPARGENHNPSSRPHRGVEWNEWWDKLQEERASQGWDEEQFQFEKIFGEEDMVDAVRSKREDEKGDGEQRALEQRLNASRYVPGTSIVSREYERMKRYHELRADGLTDEQIKAQDQRMKRAGRANLEEMLQGPSRPRVKPEPRPKATPEPQNAVPVREAPPPRSPPRSVSRRGRITETSYHGHVPLEPIEEVNERPRSRRTRQRKTYHKERASRRLAGLAPKYGLLEEGMSSSRPIRRSTRRR